MKKIILFSFIALCTISCKNSNLTINGNVDNKALNGKTIYIKERINREWKSIDSTIIENGKFDFKGIADTAKIAYIVYEYLQITVYVRLLYLKMEKFLLQSTLLVL